MTELSPKVETDKDRQEPEPIGFRQDRCSSRQGDHHKPAEKAQVGQTGQLCTLRGPKVGPAGPAVQHESLGQKSWAREATPMGPSARPSPVGPFGPVPKYCVGTNVGAAPLKFGHFWGFVGLPLQNWKTPAVEVPLTGALTNPQIDCSNVGRR